MTEHDNQAQVSTTEHNQPSTNTHKQVQASTMSMTTEEDDQARNQSSRIQCSTAVATSMQT